MPNPMSKKVALVTGGARGIGRAIALDLGRDHYLAITHLHSAPDGLPEDALCIEADLSDAASHAEVISAIIERFGRLDVLVNNAGVIAPSPVEGADPDALRNIFDVNVLAPHGLLAAALPHLGAGAAVVGISSVNAVLPPKGAALYGASKAALDLWTKAMAKELGPRGIRVNAVAPGAINLPDAPRDAELTEAFVALTALGRLATADDIAAAVRYLASDNASSITGEVLTVSGGYRL
ncbi:SDR family NAD(P)-dependent oxidoreductase [Sulfitobacter delicatus]|uniref:3-oxoacyl-[acyl-carrier protein] reductase n=1 Tax=Sulfitobacter delicatus TaxID=218672 RepID=A0A1G7L029_9RHOB|nr:SDR family oxidoreductase [Sulfitobacter delicatus]SDF42460.1 3-oxoacyl-[acyl-carrier protein] reductase [Sulfitobacter delicatus]